jgi:ABC-type ATPase involved in cell division
LLQQLQVYQQRGGTIVMVTHEQALIERVATQHWRIEAGELHVQQEEIVC